jgi:hypothetical protein
VLQPNHPQNQISDGPADLIAGAESAYTGHDLTALTPTVLARITRERGVDAATALL